MLSRVLKTNFKTRKVIPSGRTTRMPVKIFVRRCFRRPFRHGFGDAGVDDLFKIRLLHDLLFKQEMGKLFQFILLRGEDSFDPFDRFRR